jgi:tetratricopeptide (TPR) repeat protein
VYLWRFRAVAHLAAGEGEDYRQTCAAMAERFAKDDDAVTASNVVQVCVLRGDALPDMGRLLPLARVAAPAFHQGVYVLGAALYRAGRYGEAVQCFEAAAKTYRPRAWDWAFLAMAHQRLGHAGEARRCLDEAARWIEEAERRKDDDLFGMRPGWGGWSERVIYPLLLREAEALVGARATKT